jgi:hypothetical protein
VGNFTAEECFRKYWTRVGPTEIEFKKIVLGKGSAVTKYS